MALPRLIVVTCHNDRAIRKYVRGFLGETSDSELAGSTGASLGANEPLAVTIDGGWQRPVLSAPNVVATTAGNPSGRLCVWCLWGDTLAEGGNDRLTALSQGFAEIRVFRQQLGSGETIAQFHARWRGLSAWVDRELAPL